MGVETHRTRSRRHKRSSSSHKVEQEDFSEQHPIRMGYNPSDKNDHHEMGPYSHWISQSRKRKEVGVQCISIDGHALVVLLWSWRRLRGAYTTREANRLGKRWHHQSPPSLQNMKKQKIWKDFLNKVCFNVRNSFFNTDQLVGIPKTFLHPIFLHWTIFCMIRLDVVTFLSG